MLLLSLVNGIHHESVGPLSFTSRARQQARRLPSPPCPDEPPGRLTLRSSSGGSTAPGSLGPRRLSVDRLDLQPNAIHACKMTVQPLRTCASAAGSAQPPLQTDTTRAGPQHNHHHPANLNDA